MKLQQVMTRAVVAVSPAMTLEEGTNTLASHHVSGAPVFDGTKLVGVFSASDVVEHAGDPKTTLVSQVMTPYVLWLSTQDSLDTAIATMAREHVHRIVVLSQDGAVAGIVTASDVFRALSKEHDKKKDEEHPDPAVAVPTENRHA